MDASQCSPEDADFGCVIDVPYLLTLNIGLVQAKDGCFYADRSWAKDLLRHADYLPRLIYLAPVEQQAPPADYTLISDELIKVVPYRRRGGRIGGYLTMLALFSLLLRMIPRVQIVHTGIAGYPFPAAWLAVPLARLWRRKIVITVESSPWRIPANAKVGVGARARARIWERLNRWCMRQADYASYPHEDYRRSLPAPRAGGGVLFQASWVEQEQIRSADDVRDMWAERQARAPAVRYLFCARMLPEKGTRVLASALQTLAARDANVFVDLIGVGPELEQLAALSRTDWGREHLSILAPVGYGPEFFALLRKYTAVLVPNLGEEQPRIVYDAYSQGVPVIASDTAGLRVCVRDGVTGRLVPAGDAEALANAMIKVQTDFGLAERWGIAARHSATGFTHEQMHRERCLGLQRLL